MRRPLILLALLTCVVVPRVQAADGPMFPLFLDKIPEEHRGKLPLPFGAGLNLFYRDETLVFDDFEASINGNPVRFIGVRSIESNRTFTTVARTDLWVLPVMNVYGFAGRTTGKARDLELELVGEPVPTNFDIPTKATQVGIGTTLAAGVGVFFVSYDINRAWSSIDDDIIEGWIVTDVYGLRAGVADAWFGAHQVGFYAGSFTENIRGRQTGKIEVDGTRIEFATNARAHKPQNTIVGVQLVPTPHWQFVFETGFSGRNQILVSGAYRW